MSRIIQYQSSFTMGEFDPLVKGRVDIAQYAAGLESNEHCMYSSRCN